MMTNVYNALVVVGIPGFSLRLTSKFRLVGLGMLWLILTSLSVWVVSRSILGYDSMTSLVIRYFLYCILALWLVLNLFALLRRTKRSPSDHSASA